MNDRVLDGVELQLPPGIRKAEGIETDDEDTPYKSTRTATFSGMFWNS
jgi:hypothetical protein